MAKEELAGQVDAILLGYDPTAPGATADKLRELWLQSDPQSMDVIRAGLREQQETIGIPVPVLKSIGKGIGRVARTRVDDYLPLTQLLWNDYGREGRVVAVVPLGAMELVDPERVVPLLRDMCRTCLTWEDADRFAMYALEPIVREQPDDWLSSVEPWLGDESVWVRRAGAIVVGRLPMKQPQYAERCLALLERLLRADEVDVRKAVSFAIRLIAPVDPSGVHDFLAQNAPPEDPAATWVLCDVIRSMGKKHLPEFVDLLPLYEEWGADESLDPKELRSINSAVNALKKVEA